MIEFLQTINNSTNGTAVILGNVAQWLNGYREQPTGKFIDIAITSDQTGSLDSLGTRLEIDGGTTFPQPVIEQYLIKTENYYLDVFVQNTLPGSTLISGSNILTPEADIAYHTDLHTTVNNDYTLAKLNSRKELYGL